MSIQTSPNQDTRYLYGVKRTPTTLTPIRVPVSTRVRVSAPAPEPTPAVRFPKDLAEHLNFAFNPGAWR